MANEKRLIDANALIDEWNTKIKQMRKDSDGAYPVDFAIVISEVSKAPTVDAVEVVRCRDCKYFTPESIIVCRHCALTGMQVVDEDDFCSYGERRTE